MISKLDSALGLTIDSEDFEIIEINECPICSETEEKESVMVEAEFRKGMQEEPNDFYSEGEEGDEVFYMKQVKICSVCSNGGLADNVFEEDLDDEDDEEVFDDF